jgi:phage terminase large subunit GpA-like protein
MSRISREYEASDRQRYFVPCPLCGHYQILEFERMRWQPSRPDTVQYQWAHCEGTFAEHHKTMMLARGE